MSILRARAFSNARGKWKVKVNEMARRFYFFPFPSIIYSFYRVSRFVRSILTYVFLFRIIFRSVRSLFRYLLMLLLLISNYYSFQFFILLLTIIMILKIDENWTPYIVILRRFVLVDIKVKYLRNYLYFAFLYFLSTNV